MGRTSLILLLTLFFGIGFASAIEFTAEYSPLSEYYFGGEYLVFFATIKPEANSVNEFLSSYYNLSTELDSGGIIVELSYENGKHVLHPTSKDYYKSFANKTILSFYLPEGGKLKEISIRTFGYVPKIENRIKNITIFQLSLDSIEICSREIIVVNKQRFYGDIQGLFSRVCTDEDREKLAEILDLYTAGEYSKANAKLKEVEISALKCEVSRELNKLKEEWDKARDDLLKIQMDLILLATQLELRKDKIENYENLKLFHSNLSSLSDSVYSSLKLIKKLIDSGQIDEAKEKLSLVTKELIKLEDDIKKLNSSILKSEGKRKGLFNLPDKYLISIMLLTVFILVAVIIVTRRRREKW